MTILGVDTSNHNHPNGAAINWQAVAASGHAFAILKATEGIGFIDRYLNSDRAAAHAAGLLVGLYHFARAGDPVAQARYFLSVVGPLAVGEFVVLDDEDPAITPAWVQTWCDTVYAATTVKPLVYINQSVQNTQNWAGVVADNDGEWLAKYDGTLTQPSGGPWGAPAMKQYSDAGSVAGIAGGVDLDVFYGDVSQLAAYGLHNPTPTPPAPIPEDPLVKNLILGRDTTAAATGIWVGDGVVRRHVADDAELSGLVYWIGQKGGDTKVYEFADLRVLGEPLQSDVAALSAEVGAVQTPTIDEAKLAAALLSDPQSVDRLGAAIAAHLQLGSK